MKNQCKSCGYTNIDEAIFCATCGEKIVQKVETDQTHSLTLKSGLIYLSLILLSYSFTVIFLDLVYAMLYKYPVSFVFVVESIEINFYYSYAIYKLLFIVLLVYIIRVLLIKNGKYSEKLFIVLIIAISFIFHIIYYYAYAESMSKEEENTTKQRESEKGVINGNKTEIIKHESVSFKTLEEIKKNIETNSSYRIIEIEQDKDKNYVILVKEEKEGFNNSLYYLYKFNQNGYQVWKKSINIDHVYKVFVQDTGFVVFASLDTNLMMIQLNQEGIEIFRNKIDDTYLCEQLYSNIHPDMRGEKDYWIRLTDIQAAENLTFILSGTLDCWYTPISIKIDHKGKKIWQVRGDIQRQIKDGYIVAGLTGGRRSGFKVLLIKLDHSGNKIWEKELGRDNRANYARDMIVDNDSVVFIGFTNSVGSYKDDDIWVVKLNDKGETIWEKTFSYGKYDEGKWIQMTLDGNYLIIANHEIIKLDTNGELLWDKSFGQNIQIEKVDKLLSNVYSLRGSEKRDNEDKKWEFILDLDTL